MGTVLLVGVRRVLWAEAALFALEGCGYLDATDATVLREGYVFLRKLSRGCGCSTARARSSSRMERLACLRSRVAWVCATSLG